MDGDPGYDVFGMDVARFGSYAANDRYLRSMTAQFYARRFVMAYPNEELPAGRPLKTTPCYDSFRAEGAQFTVNWGLEVPLYFAPMLGPAGRLKDDLTVTRLADDRFWLTGSYDLQDWHQRWFRGHLPEIGVSVRNITDDWMGFSVSGPASRTILRTLAHDDVSNGAFPFLAVRQMDVRTAQAVVGRISLTGELGYEIVVPTNRHRTLLVELREAGQEYGLRLVGDRAVDSLPLEKGYGIWSAEFRQDYTPRMSGLDRFVAFDKGDFIGREGALRERAEGPKQRHVLLEVDAGDADAVKDDGIWIGERMVGFVTSGAYGHHVRKSLALAYVDADVAESQPEFTVFVVGEPLSARILSEVPYDPKGARLRDATA